MSGLGSGRWTAGDYQIGIICALDVEKAAVILMLDEEHSKIPNKIGDDNFYTLGRIGVHNVAIACLPAGILGIGSAAIVATNMKRSFPIKFGLMVGVGGGVWSRKHDVRLGDVVVGQPEGQHGGVVQWDFGKTQGGKFIRTGMLNKPPRVLLNALQGLKARHWIKGSKVSEILLSLKADNPHAAKSFAFPGVDQDQLFEALYDHPIGEDDCDSCNTQQAIKRHKERKAPEIHFGIIASGNQVIKHGPMRDEIAKGLGALCFEMEAAGLDDFPCLIIRGICDYADSHKNKQWQPYAAVVAAAFTKEFLEFIEAQEVVATEVAETYHFLMPFDRNQTFVAREKIMTDVVRKLHAEDSDDTCQRVAIFGLGGVGKSQVAIEAAFRLRSLKPSRSIFWVPATDVTNFENAYLEIGRLLSITGINEQKADIKFLVKDHLSRSSSRWLLIVDNADDIELLYGSPAGEGSKGLADWLPRSGKGAVLFTTRNYVAAVDLAQTKSNILTLDCMDQDESLQMLDACLVENSAMDNSIELQKVLCGLPLAIKQATAYINKFQMTVLKYLEIYKTSDQDSITLLSHNFEDENRYPGIKNPIVATCSYRWGS